jgi:hypothetical protein
MVHAEPLAHLQKSPIGGFVLNDGSFFGDMRAAAERYFAELQESPALQGDMLARLNNIAEGGSIYVGP